MNINIFKNRRIMDVKTYGDEVLKKTAVPVEEINKEILGLADNMKETMYKQDGVGLAAPQVGVSIRMTVLGVPMFDREKMPPQSPGELLLMPKMPVVLVNPEITVITDKQMLGEEGCLSVPMLYARVSRPERVMLSAELLTGEKVNIECAGFLARVIQHEVDHLNGVLFVDRLEDDEYDKIKSGLKQLEKDKKRVRK